MYAHDICMYSNILVYNYIWFSLRPAKADKYASLSFFLLITFLYVASWVGLTSGSRFPFLPLHFFGFLIIRKKILLGLSRGFDSAGFFGRVASSTLWPFQWIFRIAKLKLVLHCIRLGLSRNSVIQIASVKLNPVSLRIMHFVNV